MNRAQVSEYFKKFDALARRWKRWKTVFKIHGASLRVHIEGILIKEFQLVYQDELGGAWPAMIKKKLHEVGAREVWAAAKKAAAVLKTGPCSRCKKAGLLFDERSLKAVSLCRICMNEASTTAYQQWRVEDAARSKREREEYRRKGFKFLLDVWIHPKRGGSDYYVEVPFKTRPTARDAEKIARGKGSAIGDDFSITRLLLLFALLGMASCARTPAPSPMPEPRLPNFWGKRACGPLCVEWLNVPDPLSHGEEGDPPKSDLCAARADPLGFGEVRVVGAPNAHLTFHTIDRTGRADLLAAQLCSPDERFVALPGDRKTPLRVTKVTSFTEVAAGRQAAEATVPLVCRGTLPWHWGEGRLYFLFGCGHGVIPGFFDIVSPEKVWLWTSADPGQGDSTATLYIRDPAKPDAPLNAR